MHVACRASKCCFSVGYRTYARRRVTSRREFTKTRDSAIIACVYPGGGFSIPRCWLECPSGRRRPAAPKRDPYWRPVPPQQGAARGALALLPSAVRLPGLDGADPISEQLVFVLRHRTRFTQGLLRSTSGRLLQPLADPLGLVEQVAEQLLGLRLRRRGRLLHVQPVLLRMTLTGMRLSFQ